GDMPELARLLGERRDQMRMAVAKRVHRDTGREIEVALAAFREQPGAFASLECHRYTGKGLEYWRTAHYMRSGAGKSKSRPHGRPFRLISSFRLQVNEKVMLRGRTRPGRPAVPTAV